MIGTTIRTGLLSIAAVMVTASLAMAQTSTPFSGAKVNGGTATHTMKDGKHVLTLSSDFQEPDTPDPHWQVVDSKGNHYCCSACRSKVWAASRRIDQHVDHPAGVHEERRQGADLLRVGGGASGRSLLQQSRDDGMS